MFWIEYSCDSGNPQKFSPETLDEVKRVLEVDLDGVTIDGRPLNQFITVDNFAHLHPGDESTWDCDNGRLYYGKQ